MEASGIGSLLPLKGAPMKTLYVSDLDGTLLHSDATVSGYTADVINALVNKGMLFSYATARSYVTASKVTRAIQAKIPLIVYNGALVIDNSTGKILLSNFFGEDAKPLLADLLSHQVYPIVYAFVDGVEKFSYVEKMVTPGMQQFLDTRPGDPRRNPVASAEELFLGDIFYFTCIDSQEKLEPLWHKYRQVHHTVYDRDIYSGAQWLELMPAAASKSNAAAQLKKLLGCDRLVAFGDGSNDIDLFQLADEAYAVSNASDKLKAVATAVIPSNDEDGVARWLSENVQ